jgi:Ca2+-binding EF-hand superfamily protein
MSTVSAITLKEVVLSHSAPSLPLKNFEFYMSFPDDWYQEAFRIPGLDQGIFDQKTLTEVFKEIDADKKGAITGADLRQLMNIIGEKVDENDIDEMMRLVDPENTGTIAMEQFTVAFGNPGPLFFSSVTTVDPSLAKLPTKKKRKGKDHVHDDVEIDLERSALERYQLFDDLLSGNHLTTIELEAIADRFANMERQQRRSNIKYTDLLRGLQMNDSEQIQRAFGALDRVGLGEIDWKEFVVGLSQFAQMSREDKVRFAFRMFDRDNNGTIDREEITRIVRSTAPTWAQPQWLSRRVDELYDSLSLKRNTDIDLETFLIIAEEHPEVIAPEIAPRQVL